MKRKAQTFAPYGWKRAKPLLVLLLFIAASFSCFAGKMRISDLDTQIFALTAEENGYTCRRLVCMSFFPQISVIEALRGEMERHNVSVGLQGVSIVSKGLFESNCFIIVKSSLTPAKLNYALKYRVIGKDCSWEKLSETAFAVTDDAGKLSKDKDAKRLYVYFPRDGFCVISLSGERLLDADGEKFLSGLASLADARFRNMKNNSVLINADVNVSGGAGIDGVVLPSVMTKASRIRFLLQYIHFDSLPVHGELTLTGADDGATDAIYRELADFISGVYASAVSHGTVTPEHKRMFRVTRSTAPHDNSAMLSINLTDEAAEAFFKMH